MNILLACSMLANVIIIALHLKLIKMISFYKTTIENLHVSKTILEKELLEKSFEENNVHTDNFIKFLSDSRESAYEYIEQVQTGLKTFVNTVDEDIKYFDQYGIAGPGGPDYELMKKLSNAYKDLIKLVPEK